MLSKIKIEKLFEIGQHGNTVLHCAAMKGRHALMDFILLKCSGCAVMLPNKKNHRSETPLHLAASVHNKGKDVLYQLEINRLLFS